MPVQKKFRLLRGAVRNAFVWGVCWAGLTFPTFAILRLLGVVNDTVPWIDALLVAARFGIVGTIAGGAFSVVVSIVYHGRRLSDINWLRFGIAGGVATALFVPVFLQTMNFLSGDGLVAWRLVLGDSVTGVFGTLAAAGSLKLAQMSDKKALENADELAPLVGLERLIARNLSDPCSHFPGSRN